MGVKNTRGTKSYLYDSWSDSSPTEIKPTFGASDNSKPIEEVIKARGVNFDLTNQNGWVLEHGFTMKNDSGNTSFVTLRDAARNQTAVVIGWLDGAITDATAKGFKMEALVTAEQVWDEDKLAEIKFTFKPYWGATESPTLLTGVSA